MGPRGLTVLSIAGIAGLVFGVYGWTQRGTDLIIPQATAPSASAPASPAAPISPSAAASPSAAGPELSSMPYASFAYLVWPGPVSTTGKLALSGWTLTVTRQPGGITVQASLGGQAMTSVSHFYPGGAKVYILDSALGHSTETSEGLEVTNAQGQVLP